MIWLFRAFYGGRLWKFRFPVEISWAIMAEPFSFALMADISRKPVYMCGDYRIDLLCRRITVNDAPLMVTAKAFDVLAVLMERAGEVVTKDELLNTVWADAIVEENNLTQQISTLRKLFNERAGDHRFIVTVPGRGYCFVAPLEEETPASAPSHRELFIAGSETSTITIDISSPESGPFRSISFDPAAIRGAAFAAIYVFLVCFSAFVLGGEGSSASDARPRVVGVMTFRTIGAGDDRYGVGLRDTLRAKLGSLEDVSVRPGIDELPVSDTLAVGRRMNVDVVLAGSIQQHRDRVRVAVELVDVRGERIVWGKTFEDDVSNLFELQDQIAAEVARNIRGSRRSFADRHFRRGSSARRSVAAVNSARAARVAA